MDNATTLAVCDAQCLELIRWAISILVPALSGLVGVAIGAWLTGRRERGQRRLSYVERQLKDFYSPMLGLRNEIQMHGQLRCRIQETANTVWQELCAEARKLTIDALSAFSQNRSAEFTKIIEYDNKKLQEELLPAYRQMAKLFRENFWLAELETRAHYADLIEFVELWDRWMAKSIPAEVIDRLGHSEEKLDALYQYLQDKHDSLRKKLQDGVA